MLHFVNYGTVIPVAEFFIFLYTSVILNKFYFFLVYAEQITSSLIISADTITASEKTTCVV